MIKIYRPKRNEPIEVIEFHYSIEGIKELEDFIGGPDYILKTTEHDTKCKNSIRCICAMLNGKEKCIHDGVHLIKTPNGIFVVPDFDLLNEIYEVA